MHWELKKLEMKTLFNLNDGDALFFSCASESEAANLAGKARVKIATDRELIEKNIFKFLLDSRLPYV